MYDMILEERFQNSIPSQLPKFRTPIQCWDYCFPNEAPPLTVVIASQYPHTLSSDDKAVYCAMMHTDFTLYTAIDYLRRIGYMLLKRSVDVPTTRFPAYYTANIIPPKHTLMLQIDPFIRYGGELYQYLPCPIVTYYHTRTGIILRASSPKILSLIKSTEDLWHASHIIKPK